MVTARDAVTDRVKGLDTGADDYLVKPAQLDELQARVRALLRRRNPEQTEVLRFNDLELDTGTRVAHRSQREIELSTTEYELLQLFLRRPRQVLTRDIIMERVWGYDFGGASNVLEVYVGYLRSKLEADGEPRLLHTVRGAGYTLREKSESEQKN
jgi:two-component system response regulator MprA